MVVRLALRRPADHGTIGPYNVVPSMALVPKRWSYAGAPFHTGKRGVGAAMELPFILGEGLPVALVPSVPSYHRCARRPRRPGVRPAPRAATGRRVRARRPRSGAIADGDSGVATRRRRPAHAVLGADRRGNARITCAPSLRRYDANPEIKGRARGPGASTGWRCSARNAWMARSCRRWNCWYRRRSRAR